MSIHLHDVSTAQPLRKNCIAMHCGYSNFGSLSDALVLALAPPWLKRFMVQSPLCCI